MIEDPQPTILNELQFDTAIGIGFMPFSVPPCYDEAYFNKYVAYARTAFGVALNSMRVGLVSRYLAPHDTLVDIGVGDGAFLRARGGPTYGYDINPVAQRMLMERNVWRDPTLMSTVYAASFWDVLEHMERPEDIVKKILTYCFVSIPVFRDRQHVLKSRHYRPDEHCWYFTRHGLISWFWDLGFVCDTMNDMETSLGREDIGTFVFRRKTHHWTE